MNYDIRNGINFYGNLQKITQTIDLNWPNSRFLLARVNTYSLNTVLQSTIG